MTRDEAIELLAAAASGLLILAGGAIGFVGVAWAMWP